jgi:hypothetical protein
MNVLFRRILLTFSVLLFLLAFVTAYSYFIEPSRLKIKKLTVSVPNWSVKLNGFKVVAISDVHGGSNNVTEDRLRELVQLANAENPDIIVLLGDYISEQPGNKKELRMPVATIAEKMRGFQAKYGVYAVIGNHDWWHDEAKISQAFEQSGIKVLENRNERFQVGDETVNIWGIEDFWKKRRVPLEPFNVLPEKKNVIAITHNPDSLLQSPPEIALMFAGHSHGGQVKFPFYGAIAFVNDSRLMAGHVEIDGKNVFVTTGVGCSGPQVRFAVPPEIAVVTLSAE